MEMVHYRNTPRHVRRRCLRANSLCVLARRAPVKRGDADECKLVRLSFDYLHLIKLSTSPWSGRVKPSRAKDSISLNQLGGELWCSPRPAVRDRSLGPDRSRVCLVLICRA